MMNYLLSIAIATKNRELYCIEAIKSILSFEDNRIEICIADNSDTKRVSEFLESINYRNIKYLYNNAPITSIDNFNKAIELTTGEYVILIGDDDTVLPDIMETVEWAKNNNIKSLSPSKNVDYFWPNASPEYKTGYLSIPNSTINIRKVDTRKELEKLIKNGIQNYLLFNLPKTYHGLVKKEVFDSIKQITGNYYGGLSPDIYSCVAVACLVEEHYIIDKQISIAGVCSVSTTADNMSGKHSGKLENIPHFKNRDYYNWDQRIPKFYSVNTIWAETALQALVDLNERQLLKKFNIYALVVHSWIQNKKYIKNILEEESLKVLKKVDKYSFIIFVKLFYTLLKINFFRVSNKLKRIFSTNKLNNNIEYYDVPTIINAIEIYKESKE